MRQQFIESVTVAKAYQLCPWAELVIKVEGGCMAFESPDDYDAWANQK